MSGTINTTTMVVNIITLYPELYTLCRNILDRSFLQNSTEPLQNSSSLQAHNFRE